MTRARWLDPALGLLLGAGWLVDGLRLPGDRLVTTACGLAIGLALALRRTAPLPVFVVVLVGLVASSHASPGFADGAIASVLALMLALYTLGVETRGLEAGLAVAGVAAAVAVLAVQDPSNEYTIGDLAFYVVVCGLPWAVGVALRLRVERVRDVEARHAALEHEAARALADERARIARELHDVVSHAIAVTVLQARGALKLVDRDDAAVLAALDAVEQTNVAALADMRRLLDLLRSQEDRAHDEPAPTLERLDRLVAQVRASGLPVEVSVTGRPLPVPPGLDLSAYRIVQEALTNALKHGGPLASARVLVDYEADELAVEVRNTGTVGAMHEGGHGLVGIRERVAVAGGTVAAGPSNDGFVVRARLPYLVASSW